MANAVTPQLTVRDLQLLADGGSADLADTLLKLLGQPDPQTGPVPKGALDVAGFQYKLQEAYGTWDANERRVKIALLWQKYLTQTEPAPAPRFLLADFLVSLYEKNDEPSRAALVEIALAAPLRLGVWGGLKRVLKLAEARHDALVFGAIACRIDTEAMQYGGSGDVSKGTLIYLKRRVWRYLRQLGKAMPELYPQFAAAALVHYPDSVNVAQSWLAAHVLMHESKNYDGTSFLTYGAIKEYMKDRAYDDAWKQSSDPLMVLLESCKNDAVARFAIQSLQRDFPDVLRKVDAAWLDRLARRPLGGIHDFVVDTLQGSPEFHAAKLKGLGLHETALSLLLSPSQKARTYAIEYARAHAQDLPAERLVEYALCPHKDTTAWALALLQRQSAKQIGHALLGRLINSQHKDWAIKTLEEGFDRADLPRAWLTDMLFGENQQPAWALSYLTKKYRPEELGADFWKGVIGDQRAKEKNPYVLRPYFTELLKFPAEAVGGAWALDALQNDQWRGFIEGWLRQVEALPGADVERLKGFVFDVRLRPTALALLARPKIARFQDLTLGWLLALARRADPTLNQWATRYLLQNTSPSDAGGVERLLELATGAKEPEPVRSFAQTYLLVHHPTVGPEQPQSASYQLKPQLTLEAYKPEPYWKALFDARPDVRRFAVTITKASLRRWGWLNRVYELADSENKEVRNVAFDALLKAGAAGADPQHTLAPEEIEAEKVFAMTESRIRASRELAMELIARHYERLGGPERLAWLMASSDRVIRQMAVRMLWERHRPKSLPAGWKPKLGAESFIAEGQRFADVEALRSFLRTLLFGLPPGRAPEPAEGNEGIRRLPAGESKRRAVESARDLALDDGAFAQVISPLLLEFSGSVAKGEWETCLSALVALQQAHPTLNLGLMKGA